MMENKKTMSTLEVLNMTRGLLLGISIPIGLYKEIGEPILGAANNLLLCINAIQTDKDADSTSLLEKDDLKITKGDDWDA